MRANNMGANEHEYVEIEGDAMDDMRVDDRSPDEMIGRDPLGDESDDCVVRRLYGMSVI